MAGVLLLLSHPSAAARSCDACLRWIFNTETGTIVRDHTTGKPIARPKGSSPPCHSCPKCNGSAEKSPRIGRGSELSARNQMTLQCYYAHRVMPRQVDDVAEQNFAMLYELFTSHDRLTSQSILASLMLPRV